MESDRIRVLIIEDDLVDRMAFERFIRGESLPYDVLLVESADAARETLRARQFDVIVSDYLLGSETCLELFDEMGDVPVVVVTGTGDEATAVAAMKRGASDYLIKDPHGHYLTILPVTVQNALKRKRAEDELKAYREHLEELVRQRTAALRAEIAARERAEEERTLLQEQLHHSQKMEAIGQLAGGVAHDFNNLLLAIFSYCSLARGKLPDNHEAIAMLKGVEEAAEQAAGVTKSLLTFSRRTGADKRTIELTGLVERTVHLLRRLLPSTIEVQLDIPDESPVWLNADTTQLQQVVMNLAINARDAMPDGGVLRISVRQGSEGGKRQEPESQPVVQIEVSDTGAGMTEEIQRRIFEPFFTTKSRGQGTGLGLAVVHGMVHDHDGRVDVRSEVGKGSTFTITLPCLSGEGTASIGQATLDTSGGHGELVLLAEDDWHVCNVVAAALRSFGYEVMSAADGPAFLKLAEERADSARLLMVDVDLPGRNGLDCLNDLRVAGCNTPAVVVTGKVDDDLDRSLDEHTVLLRKPFQVGALGGLVAKMLATG